MNSNSSRRSTRYVFGAFPYVGMLFLFIPCLLFTYFPSQDGPAHVNTAAVVNHLTSGDSFFIQYFRLIPLGLTNCVGEIVYNFLIAHVAPDHVDMLAIILYISFALLTIQVCCRYFLKIPSEAGILFYPLIFTHMLNMGSYNLSLATFGYLTVISMAYAYVTERKNKWLYGLSVALVITFLLHIQIALLSFGVVAIAGLWLASAHYFLRRNSVGTDSHGGAIATIIKLAAAVIPAFALVVYFILCDVPHIASHPQPLSVILRLEHLFVLTGIASYSLFGLAISATFFCGLVILIIIVLGKNSIREKIASDWLLLSALVLGALSVFIPDGIGDIFNIQERIMIPFLLTIIVWLGVHVKSIRNRNGVVLFIWVILGLQFVDRLAAFDSFNQKTMQFSEIRHCVPEQQAFFNLDLDNIGKHRSSFSVKSPFQTNMRFSPFLHFPGTLFATQEIADVSNYEALRICPYFPIKYQPWLDTIVGPLDIGEKAALESGSGMLTDFLSNLKKGNHPVNYLLTSEFYPDSNDAQYTQAVHTLVHSKYDLVCTSSSGAVQVYQMKTGQTN